MRTISWLTALAALALGGVACKDRSPQLTSSDTTRNDARPDADKVATRMQHTGIDKQRDAVLGSDANATVKMEPADKQALRVQREEKEGDPAQAQRDEKAQYAEAKEDSLAVPDSAGAAGEDLGTRILIGQAKSVSDSQVELKASGDQDLKLAVDEQTAVRIDGQQSRAAQIHQGSEVRASYRAVNGKLTALRLDVTTKGKLDMPATPKSDAK